jgi:small GTP-binding protein
MSSFPLLKVMLLGDGNVGKTSLARRFCEGKFEQSRVLTIGVDFQTKVVQLKSGSVKLSIWDVAGQPRFQVVRETFYRGCLAAALIFDLTDLNSLLNLDKWLAEIKAFAPNTKFLIAGNKFDLYGKEICLEGKEFAVQHKLPYIETSAATGKGVEDLFIGLAYLGLMGCK